MFEIKCIFVLAVFIIIKQSDALVSLPKVEDNNIIKAESVIRSTVNTLFSNIGLKNVKDKPRLKQYSLVHNYFVSLTLQDYNSLKEIAKLTRVDKNHLINNTVDYIDLLNEILDEENVAKLQSIIMGVDLKTAYDIEEKQEYLKNFYNADQRDKNIELNKEVLKILQREETLDLNVTTKAPTYYTGNDFLLDDLPTWYEEEEALTSGRRIYNSKRTKIKKFPFMASVQIFHKFQCGGAIIKSDLVITAASCLQLAWNNRFYRENPLFLSVRVGSSFYEAGGENIGVMEVYFHPSYNPKNLHHNVAVVRLIRKIRLKKKSVKKILLDTEEHGLPTNVDGVQILGWGAKTGANKLHGPWEDKLSFATLRVYSLEDCQDVYSKEYVTHQHFCAGSVSVGSGACNRDVGDPGIVSGKLTGIVSFGAPVCGTPDAPTVFTKVGFYYNWIEEIMDQDVPSVEHRTTTPSPTYPYELPNYIYNPWFIQPVSTDQGYDVTTTTSAVNLLRNVDKNMFKEFLKTMFNSAEVKEYLDKMTKPKSEVPAAVKPPIQNPKVKQIVQPTKQAIPQFMQKPVMPNPVMQKPILQKPVIPKPLMQPSLQRPIMQPNLQQSIPKELIMPQQQLPVKPLQFIEQPIIQQQKSQLNHLPVILPPILQQPDKKQLKIKLKKQQQTLHDPTMQVPDRQERIKQQQERQQLKKKKLRIKKKQPIGQNPLMLEQLMQESIREAPLIIQKPVVQQSVMQDTVVGTQELLTPESKTTAILEEATLFPIFNENEKGSGESSEENTNSTVIIPYNFDTLTTSANLYEGLGTSSVLQDLAMDEGLGTSSVFPDLAMDENFDTSSVLPNLDMEVGSTSDEEADHVKDPDNELYIRIKQLDDGTIIRNEATVEIPIYLKKKQLSSTTATSSFPHKYYKHLQKSKNQKNILKQRDTNDNIDNSLLTLLYLSDSEIDNVAKKRNKQLNTESEYDKRKFNPNKTAIQAPKQYSPLTEGSLANLDLRKFMDNDFLMNILNEEFASGFKSLEVSVAPEV